MGRCGCDNVPPIFVHPQIKAVYVEESVHSSTFRPKKKKLKCEESPGEVVFTGLRDVKGVVS